MTFAQIIANYKITSRNVKLDLFNELHLFNPSFNKH